MQPQFGQVPGTLNLLMGLAALWGLITTVFWMVVGWGAMRAHERMSESVEQLARKRD